VWESSMFLWGQPRPLSQGSGDLSSTNFLEPTSTHTVRETTKFCMVIKLGVRIISAARPWMVMCNLFYSS